MQRFASASSFALPIAGGLRRPVFLAVAASLAMLAFLLWPRHAMQFPYTPDSADYIEQARSLLRGENARVLSDSIGTTATEPTRLFPLGFPLALAALGTLGVEPATGAVLLNGAAAVLLPLLLYYLFAPVLLGGSLAVAIAMAVFSPGLWNNARDALSDTFALLFCVTAIGVLARGREHRAFALAGLLTGAAYAIRNANVALVGAFYAYFILALLVRFEPRRALLTQAAWFTAALGVVVLPLALRNLLTFGQFNPYSMPPSTIGLLTNARMFVAAITEDLTASYPVAKFLAWNPLGELLCASLLVAGAVWAARKLPALPMAARRATLVSLLFAAFGALVVVIARTRYEWGDLIGVRHTFPYVPFIALAVAALVQHAGLSHAGRRPSPWLAAAAVVLVVSKLASFAVDFVTLVHARPTPQASALEQGREAFCGPPNDALLVSNFGFVFRIACRAPVHGTAVLRRPLDMAAFFGHVAEEAGRRPATVGLFPGFRGVELGDLPIEPSVAQRLGQDRFEVLRNDRLSLVAARPAP